jgi:UDP:flavonoid glycosyltransferase YjiC (YdhE family)
LRIVILPIGTIGDVRPYTALGIGLKQAGHKVSIATHESFRDFVGGQGLDFSPVSYPQELMTGGDILKLVDAGGNLISWCASFSASPMSSAPFPE